MFIGGACNSYKEFTSPAHQSMMLGKDIFYLKDVRTDLCFAGRYNDNSSKIAFALIANVPCSPEVEKSIKKFTSTGE